MNIKTKLSGNEEKVLEDVEEEVGNRLVTKRYIEFATPWILDKVVQRELNNSYVNFYITVQEEDVENGAIILSSHFLYTVYQNGNGRGRTLTTV